MFYIRLNDTIEKGCPKTNLQAENAYTYGFRCYTSDKNGNLNL